MADYSKVIELYPNESDPYHHRGLAYLYLGDYEQVIADYTRAIELNPHYDYYYCNRGFAYTMRGEHGRAAVDYWQCAKLRVEDQLDEWRK